MLYSIKNSFLDHVDYLGYRRYGDWQKRKEVAIQQIYKVLRDNDFTVGQANLILIESMDAIQRCSRLSDEELVYQYEHGIESSRETSRELLDAPIWF